MKRDTIPARPLAGARVDGGNDGQSEPRQEETLLARNGRMQNLSAGTEYSLTEFKCRADDSESVRAHASKRCRGKGAKQPKRPCGHAARPRTTIQSTQSNLSYIEGFGVVLMLVSRMDDG
jgi:hypothetical protein